MGRGNEPQNPNDLKPFSVDDPFGKKHQTTTPAASLQTSLPSPRRKPPRQKPLQPRKEKQSSGCLPAFFGCLGVLFLMGIIAAIPVVFLGGYIKEIYDQWDVRQNGVDGVANVVGLRPTSMEFNEEKVYEVDLGVQPVSGEPFTATLHSPISASELPLYEAGGRVIVRYDPDDTSRISILGPERDAPPEATPPLVVDPIASAAPDSALEDVAPDAHADDGRIIVPGPQGTVPRICRETYLCCRTVQGKNGEEMCRNFLQPMPTSKHCEMAIGVFRDVGRKTGKPCPAPD